MLWQAGEGEGGAKSFFLGFWMNIWSKDLELALKIWSLADNIVLFTAASLGSVGEGKDRLPGQV